MSVLVMFSWGPGTNRGRPIGLAVGNRQHVSAFDGTSRRLSKRAVEYRLCRHGLGPGRATSDDRPEQLLGGAMDHEKTMRMMLPILITWCRRRAPHGEPRERHHTPSLWTLLFKARAFATLDLQPT